jgi:hypothetical protein
VPRQGIRHAPSARRFFKKLKFRAFACGAELAHGELVLDA